MQSSPLDAAVVTRLNLRDRLLADFPGLAEDDTALLDTLSGIDDIEEQCLAVLRNAIEREAHAKALGELIDGMVARRRRLEEGAKNLRAAVLDAMQKAKMPGIRAPDMSVSLSAGKPRLVILDDAAVPETLCKIERKPDRKAITEWLGELDPMSVPNWVRWDAPTPFLSIHRR